MNYYWIEALSPLVFRGGKPFLAQASPQDVAFPLPSSAAGVIRTVYAQQQSARIVGQYDVAALKKIEMGGIFLAQRDDSGSLKLFAPKPADAKYFKKQNNNQYDNKVELVRLTPQPMPENSGCDLPHADLLPVQLPSDYKEKEQGGKAFWLLSDWLDWHNGKQLSMDEINQNGVNLSEIDIRTHTAIDRVTQTSLDQHLFQTAAYDFANQRKKHHQGWEETRLGFVIATDKDKELAADTVRFGGEGRLSRLEKVDLAENYFRQPEINCKKIKLTLLTPAIFAQGWLPKWIDANLLEGTLTLSDNISVRLKLRAVAMDRWLPVSGWDLAEHKPKAMRKAVPAGSVYWFEVLDDDVNANIFASLAYRAISDDEQDKLDGFGIVAITEWKE